jgi:hypothetical protein
MTTAEIQAELTILNKTINDILKGGQSYMITSASGAGTQRQVTMANLPELYKRKNDLERILDNAAGNRATRIGMGW